MATTTRLTPKTKAAELSAPRRLWRRIRGGAHSPARLAAAVGLGLFVGCTPFYGLHFFVCAGLCFALRLDLVASYLAANISNPLFAPFLLTAEVHVGAWLLGREPEPLSVGQLAELGWSGIGAALLLGSAVVGTVLAGVGAAATRALVPPMRPEAHRRLELIDRVVARYASAPKAARYYVESKLRTDPLTEHLLELGDCGRALELGCGRGQFLWLLWEADQVSSGSGIDADAPKVEIAAAAGSELTFRVADLTEADWVDADTVLLIDVLHYLPHAQQRALLAKAAAALTPSGRLLIRELDAAKLGSRLGSWFERVGTALGVNRGQGTFPVTTERLQQWLSELGLESHVVSAGGALGNVLIQTGRRGELGPDD